MYLTDGASAVLLDWRESTVDIDLKFIPDSDDILRPLPALKEQLDINVELASPGDFIPELPGARLVLSQRDHRIEPRGSSGGDVCGEERDHREQGRCSGAGRGIAWGDAEQERRDDAA